MKLTEAQVEERERLRQAEMKVIKHVSTDNTTLYCFINIREN